MEGRFMRDSEPVELLNTRSARLSSNRPGSNRVQFETPFDLWCTNCSKPSIIGQRSKFNAEKTKVESYHSKPVYIYRMQHIVCGGTIEIRASAEKGYEVVEGARKKRARDAVIAEEDFAILTEEELADRKAKAFALLEYQAEEAEKEKNINQRTLDLYEASKQFEYPFMPKREAEAIRISRAEVSRAREDLDSYVSETPPMDRAQHMKEVNAILRRQKKNADTKVKEDETHLQRANAAFASTVKRNTRAKLDPFRHASSEFGAAERRLKRKRLLDGVSQRRMLVEDHEVSEIRSIQ